MSEHSRERLPEHHRLEFIETVSEYAVEGKDTDAIDNSWIRSVFTPAEHANLIARVQAQLLPKLADVRRDRQSDCSPDQSREDHMYSFVASLDTLRRCFSQDVAALAVVDAEVRNAQDWINEDDGGPFGPPPRKLGKLKPLPSVNSVRSIFDDIDAVGDAPED